MKKNENVFTRVTKELDKMKLFKMNHIFKILTVILSMSLLFTIIGCSKETDDSISVTNITITAQGGNNLIAIRTGTLQLSATLMPTNASNKLVTWSMTDGTGSATINQDGLVTAVINGTVTAKATSKSNADVSAELVITISNQVTDNTAPLAAKITSSNANIDQTMVGTSSDQFVSSVKWVLLSDQTIYQQAITNAQATLSSIPLTDTEVADAVNVLEAATVVFNASKQDGTKIIANIDLGTADNFVLLSKTGISVTGAAMVTGDIGISPATASYITGFGLIMDSSNEFSTSSLVVGSIFAADYLVSTPATLTQAISDMMTAYNDGAGRTSDYTELYTGDLSGKTLTTGVYMWSNDVLINTDFTLTGSSTDIFIFKIAGTLTMAANTQITLSGGVLSKNIYWVVADTVAIGVGADFQGVILSMTNVSMNTGSTISGMIYAQTSISLDATIVTKP